MAFPEAFLDELAARNPIEDVVGQYVSLKPHGSNLFGLCPFHGEKTASFSVNKPKQIYYCFGCHKGGGVINFIMEIESLSYPDAVRFLAKRANMTVPEDDRYDSQVKKQERLKKLCADAARFFYSSFLSDAGKPARDYFARRGLTAETVKRFGLGYAPDDWRALTDAMTAKGYTIRELLDASLAVDKEKNGKHHIYDRFRNRVMFPIFDLSGNVIGFGGRVLDDSKPKYLNSDETVIFEKRKNLYALNYAKKSKADYMILTEGYMDTVTLHQYGFDSAVASLGTSLTDAQVNLFSKYTKKVYLTYDADAAGQNAAARAIPMLEKAGLQIRILRTEGAKDPDEYLRKFGADAFTVLLQRASNQAEYRLDAVRQKYDMKQDDQRVLFLQEAAALIATFPNAVEREVYGTRAAETAGVSPEAMKHEISKEYRKLTGRQKNKEARQALVPEIMQRTPGRTGVRYDNPKSAAAEETILRLVLTDSALFKQAEGLTGEKFSCALLGRAFDALYRRYRNALSVSLGTLEGFTAEEMTHLSAVAGRNDLLASEDAFTDCKQTVLDEYGRRNTAAGSGGLLELQSRLKEKKGYGDVDE